MESLFLFRYPAVLAISPITIYISDPIHSGRSSKTLPIAASSARTLSTSIPTYAGQPVSVMRDGDPFSDKVVLLRPIFGTTASLLATCFCSSAGSGRSSFTTASIATSRTRRIYIFFTDGFKSVLFSHFQSATLPRFLGLTIIRTFMVPSARRI
jgi:hypothetical protein